MPSPYAWIIHTSYPEGTAVKVETSGPHNASDEMLAAAARSGIPFAMYDDDGILYYRGRYIDADMMAGESGLGGDAFGPLDDYGKPNAGCTEIRYRDPVTGKWDTL
jgi:hypothetical protein